MIYMYSTRSGHSAFCFQGCITNTKQIKILYTFSVYFSLIIWVKMLFMTHQEDCKQSNSMQTRALLNLAKQLPVKGLIDNRCHALEAVPERRAIHKLNANFFLQKIKSECKYSRLTFKRSHILMCQPIRKYDPDKQNPSPRMDSWTDAQTPNPKKWGILRAHRKRAP